MIDPLKPGWAIKPDELSRYHVKRLFLPVPLWDKFSVAVALNWRSVSFSDANRDSVPQDSRGVYCFVVQPAISNHPAFCYLMYVGMVRGQGLRDRYAQYLAEEKRDVETAKRTHITRMLQTWKGRLHFFFAELPQTVDVKAVEDALLEAYIPPYNIELPSTIREPVKLSYSV